MKFKLHLNYTHLNHAEVRDDRCAPMEVITGYQAECV